MPRSSQRKSSKRVSRSVRLRKYEAAYEACVRKALSACTKHASPVRKSRSRRKKSDQALEPVKKVRSKDQGKDKKIRKSKDSTSKNKDVKNKDVKNKDVKNKDVKKSKDRKRPLNDYQKFVREESKRVKYKGMNSADRMTAIGKAWKKKQGK